MIGELGERLNKRLAKHKRVTKNNDDTNHIDEPHLETMHRITRLSRPEGAAEIEHTELPEC